jgi:TrmH family RNA methyltransferase
MDKATVSHRARSASSSRLRRIEGKHNPLVKQLRQAFSRADLTSDGDCAIEGLRILEEAIRSGLRFTAAFFAESAMTKAERLLPQLGANVETLMLPDQLFAGVVPSDSPQGVAALVRWKATSLADIVAHPRPGLVLAIAGLQDPGNLGTIIRSAEAFDAAGIIIGDGTVSPFNSKVVRGSSGSIFRLPLARAKFTEAIPQLREHGYRMLATSSHKGTSLQDISFAGLTAIVIGAEGSGVPREILGQIDEIVAIPHSPKVESLNAGVAASIILYEASKHQSKENSGNH